MAYLQGYIISVGPTPTPHSKDFFVKNLISLKESKKTHTLKHLYLKCRKTSVEETSISVYLLYFMAYALLPYIKLTVASARTQHSLASITI